MSIHKPKHQLTPKGIVRQIEHLEDAELRELASLLGIMHPSDLNRFKTAMAELVDSSEVERLQAEIQELIDG